MEGLRGGSEKGENIIGCVLYEAYNVFPPPEDIPAGFRNLDVSDRTERGSAAYSAGSMAAFFDFCPTFTYLPG